MMARNTGGDMNRPEIPGDTTLWENLIMKSKYAPEVKQRAIRLVQEQRSEYPTQWMNIVAIATKIGCSPETLRS